MIGLLLVCLAALSGCAAGDPPEPHSATQAHRDTEDSDQWMRSLLRSYQRESGDDPFFGNQDLSIVRDELAIQEGFLPPSRLLQLQVRVIDYELRLGHLDKALEMVEQSERQIQAADGLPANERVAALTQQAVAWLRVAESENCVHCQTGESCLLPIRSGGIHRQSRGSTEAIKRLEQALAIKPDHIEAAWLLNLAHMTLGSYPDGIANEFRIPPERFQNPTEFPRFHNIALQQGVATESLAGSVVADDFNNDDHIDLLISDWSTSGELRLFVNDGQGGFVDATKTAHLEGLYSGLNMVQADYDNDGHLDVLILRGAWGGARGRKANSLLRNLGHGVFRDVTRDAGLAEVHYPTQTAAWADYDRDGDLDLYVGNEDYPSQLFQNDGKGRFHDVARSAGVLNERYAKAVVWGDYDNDGAPDLFVSNYGGANRLYHNLRDGTFRDVAVDAGVEAPSKSFPAWFWDVNNDGALDLFVASYPMELSQVAREYFGLPVTAERDCLYLGDGTGRFKEVGRQWNLSHVSDPMGANFGDLDNDGFLDFYLGTGVPDFSFLVPNLMYHNRKGETFEDITFVGGFGHLQKGHGVAFADFDGDMDQDVYQVLGGAYPGDAFPNALFQNPGTSNHAISIQLQGVNSARSAIGAQICVTFSEQETEPRRVYRCVNSGGSFGCNPLRQHIGVGTATRIDSITVTWPRSGETQTFSDLEVDQTIRLIEGTPQPVVIKAPVQPTIIRDATGNGAS